MAKKSPFDIYKTDRTREIEGVVIDYPGGVRVQVARAGGQNTQFAKAHEIHMRPFRNMKPTDIPQREQRLAIAKVFVDAIIRAFYTDVAEDENQQDFQPVVVWGPDQDYRQEAVTKANLVEYLMALPDLMDAIIRDANEMNLYRVTQLEVEAKN